MTRARALIAAIFVLLAAGVAASVDVQWVRVAAIAEGLLATAVIVVVLVTSWHRDDAALTAADDDGDDGDLAEPEQRIAYSPGRPRGRVLIVNTLRLATLATVAVAAGLAAAAAADRLAKRASGGAS